MANKRYRRGTEIEYKCRNELLKQGAVLTQRMAGSKSKIDVLGVFSASIVDGCLKRQAHVKLIQCKRIKKGGIPQGLLDEVEKDFALIDVACNYIDCELWVWLDRIGWRKFKFFLNELEAID